MQAFLRYWQRILTYFVRGSITVQLTFCLYSAALHYVELETILLFWLNPNQSNSKSAVQPYKVSAH